MDMNISGKIKIVNNMLQALNIYFKGIEAGIIEEAKDWINDYYLKVVPEKYKNIAKKCELKIYLIIKDKVSLPFFFDVFLEGFSQSLYTLIILEENSRLEMNCVCSGSSFTLTNHLRIGEFYLNENSELNIFSTISWKKEIVAKDMYYYCLSNNCKLKISEKSIISCKEKSKIENILIKGNNNKVEVLTTNILKGKKLTLIEKSHVTGNYNKLRISTKLFSIKGKIKNFIFSKIEGKYNKCYSKCDEYILGKRASIKTIPGLFSNSPTNEVMHEARIGNIRKKEIEYLLARGFSPKEILYLLLMY